MATQLGHQPALRHLPAGLPKHLRHLDPVLEPEALQTDRPLRQRDAGPDGRPVVHPRVHAGPGLVRLSLPVDALQHGDRGARQGLALVSGFVRWAGEPDVGLGLLLRGSAQECGNSGGQVVGYEGDVCGEGRRG